MTKPSETVTPKPHVALFVTCLVDMFRPNVGFSAIKLLEDAGCDVSVPAAQTCCGQPAFNSGDNGTTADIARQVIEAFETYDYVVVPSGSCGGMIKSHYAELFEDDPHWQHRARDLGARTHELISFLVDIMGVDKVDAVFDGIVTYHDSCSGLRELGVKTQPRKLLRSVKGLKMQELTNPEVCCGFGGTFCVKYPEISDKMVTEKTEDIASTKAGTVLAGDLGCLMNMGGKLTRDGHSVRARHVAEVLAGMTDGPAIGDPER